MARYVKRPRRCSRAIAWSRSSSKVIADPPPASEAFRIQGREWEYLLGPFVSQSAGKGKQEVRQRVVQRRPVLPDGWGGPLSRALVHTATTKDPNRAKDLTMPPRKRAANKHAKARQRRRLKAQECLDRDRVQAQQAAKALEQALHDLGLPDDLVAEIEGRLRSQQKLLSKICGVMFPPLFGCRTNAELCRVRGWDKNLPSRLLGALPKRSWIKRLRRLGLEVLIPLWRYAASASEATRSRWQWTWVGDDSVFKKYGGQLGLVGTWWSGQEHRGLSGIDGVLPVVVIGDGKLVVPVDVAIRRPDPQGTGGPCRDKRHWVQLMLDGRLVVAD